MRDREEGGGDLFSCPHGMVAIPLFFPAFVSRIHRAGDVRRRRGSFSSLLSFFFIFFLLSRRFGSSSGLFCFTNRVSVIVFLRYSDRLRIWWRWRGRWAYNRVSEVRRVSGDSHCFFFLYCAWWHLLYQTLIGILCCLFTRCDCFTAESLISCLKPRVLREKCRQLLTP